MAAHAFKMRPMPTIFSVGRGRCVVVAADGCQDCVSAFSQFVEEDMKDDDRLIVVLIQLPEAWLQSMYGGASKEAYAERLKKDEENQSRLAERVAELMSKPSPASLHNISTPGTGTAVIDNMTAPFVMQRLKWDDRAKRDLAKFVDVAIDRTVRFEAVLLKAHNPNEAIVKYCESVGADLLVLGHHTNRLLNWVKDIQMIPFCEKNAPCDVKIMGESRLDEEPDKPAAAESAGLGDVEESV